MSGFETSQCHSMMDRLAGDWTVEAAGPDGQPWPAVGRATFDWDASRARLVQHTVTGSAEAPDSVSVMGFDGTSGRFVQLYCDERGVSRIYEMALSDDEWRLERIGEPFPQRFVATFEDAGRTISGRWEKAENGADFTLDFFLTYRRAQP